MELKKFLHPKCEDCLTEFHNRTEFDDHLLSPGHMKTSKTPPSYKSEESRKNRLQILTEADEIQGLREEKPKKEKPKDMAKEGDTTMNDGELQPNDDAEATDMKTDIDVKQEDDVDEAENQNEQEQPENEPILDYNDNDEIGPEIECKIPKYNCKRQVGSSLISKLVCFECRLCNKYFDIETTAEIHSRTYNHHRLFVKFLNEKANETKIAQKRAAAAAEENDRLKRIKLENDTASELYDPTQATGEDDPKENGKTEVSISTNDEMNAEDKSSNETFDTEAVKIPSLEVSSSDPSDTLSEVTVPDSNITPIAVDTISSVTADKPSVTALVVNVSENISESTETGVAIVSAVSAVSTVPVVSTVPAVSLVPAVSSVPAVPAVVASTPVVPQPNSSTQQQQQHQQNNVSNKQFNNNRGRGNNNNRGRRGRYGRNF